MKDYRHPTPSVETSANLAAPAVQPNPLGSSPVNFSEPVQHAKARNVPESNSMPFASFAVATLFLSLRSLCSVPANLDLKNLMKTKLPLLVLLLAALTLFTLTATPAQAGPGYALSFNGTNQSVTVPDHDALTFTNAFTWEAWVYITKPNWPYLEEWVTLFAKDSFTREAWFAVYSDGRLDARFNSQSFNSHLSTNTIAFQTWQHVAVTWDGNTVCYFLNGQPDISVTYTGSTDNTTNRLVIGLDALDGRYHFQGLMDELRLWNVARSSAEIQAAMNHSLTGTETGLVAYWPFDEASGTTVSNRAALTGSACDGSLSNAPTWVVSTIPSFQSAPAAAIAAATGIGRTNATLNGTVNPGNQPTAAWFQWGATTNYGNTSTSTNLSATNINLAVSASLGGLTPGQTYHGQLVASNSAGMVTGGDVTWTNLILPPAVTTLAASGVQFTNATLNATVNPNGLPTGAWFQWGADTNYGHLTAVTNLSATNINLAVSAALDGLTAGQTVHFRVVATNADGLTPGSDAAFTTIGMTNTVTSLADDGGSGTLRQILANAYDGQTIVFATHGTLTLTNGELVITNSLTFVGPGATNLFISGNTNSRVFNIKSTNAVVMISDVTICNGKAANGSDGGGVYNAGTLTLMACTLNANTAGNGYASTSINPGRGGNGGGVYNAGTLTLMACTLNANTAGNGGVHTSGGIGGIGANGDGGVGGNGGGVFNDGSLTLNACTFSANTAGRGANGGSENSSGNGGAGGNGGGVFNDTNASLATLRSSLFALNTAGTGGNPYGGIGGTAGSDPDLSGAFTSFGHNLVRITGNSTGIVNGVNGDLVGTAAAPVNALLGPLTNNGGATFTMALLPGSPAIDAGDDTLTGTDQRGSARKSGQHVDIGAYELDAAALGYSAPSLGGLSCTVSNLASGLSSATFSFSVNPNGLNTTAWIDYGITTSYGGTSATLYLGYTNVSVSTNLTLTGFAPGTTYHYRLSASSPAGTTTGADQSFTTTAPGDLNGDGVVSVDEMNLIGQNYWSTTANHLTGLTGAGAGRFTFGLTNAAGLNFTVLMSTNLTDWTPLTNAAGFYFNDPAATNAPQRFYRLRWP
jgi:hypothetical protein